MLSRRNNFVYDVCTLYGINPSLASHILEYTVLRLASTIEVLYNNAMVFTRCT